MGSAPATVAPSTRNVHRSDGLNACIRQAEILTNVAHITSFDPETGNIEAITHEFAIVATQDCDLESDHRSRQNNKPNARLNSILLFEAYAYNDEFKRTLPPGTEIRRRVENNDDKRYHLIDPCPEHVDLCRKGLPMLAIDFKRYFSLTPAQLEAQVLKGSAQRRARVESPFLESFMNRAAFFLSRVALPE